MIGGVCVYGVIVLVGTFVLGAIWLQRGKAREAAALRQREMLHEERLAAIEKDLPPPESIEAADDWLEPELERGRVRWMMRISLLFGLMSTGAGVGMCLAFFLANDRGFNEIWPLGFIPMLAGIGTLLFWLLSPTPHEP